MLNIFVETDPTNRTFLKELHLLEIVFCKNINVFTHTF